MGFRVYDRKTGAEVLSGDEITDFRGEKGQLSYATQANDESREGKLVAVSSNRELSNREVYAWVYGLRVEEVSDPESSLTQGQLDAINSLAQVVANQLTKLVDVPQGQRFAAMRRILDNVDTLKAWVGDDRH